MSFIDFVRRAVTALEESGVDYVIVGGLAAIYYGEPRATQDLDVILRLSPERREEVARFVEVLRSHGFTVAGGVGAVIESLKERTHFSIFNEEYVFRIDAQGVYSRLNELAFEGRRRVKLFGLSAWIQGPEDLIIAKLTEYVSSRDLKDVVAILKNSRDLIDWSRLWRLAKEFNVADKIRELIEYLKR